MSKSTAATLLAAFIFLWIAIINGQPFFYPDTTNYVRAPDAAVTAIFGQKFATSWTQSQAEKSERKIAPSNSVQEGFVISGRSPYYGGLLYLGEITSGLFLPIVVQSFILSFVLFILTVKCFELSLGFFLLLATALTLFSSAPFYVALLMPDFFAGIAILIVGMFLAFWDKIQRLERFSLAALLCYSILSHSSIQLTVIVVVGTIFAWAVFGGKKAVASKSFPTLVILSCIACGFLGEIAFNVAVYASLGHPPVRPPFLMARLIDLGPGYEYLKSNCADESFSVCRFLGRLPLFNDTFLWSQIPSQGVFSVADLDTKRRLGDEQYRFALSVMKFDPLGVVTSYVKGGVTQLFTFGLEDFRFCEVCDYENILPAKYWSTMREAIAFKHSRLIDISEWVQRFVLIASTLYLGAYGILRFRGGLFGYTEHGRQRGSQDLFLSTIIVGVLSNALICGAFSTVHERYQTRVMWLVPLMAVLVFVVRYNAKADRFRTSCA